MSIERVRKEEKKTNITVVIYFKVLGEEPCIERE